MLSVLASPRAWRIALLLLVIGVGGLAVVPVPPPDLTTGWDKLNHAAAFSALSFVARLGFRAVRSATLRVGVALLAYGGLIEIVQFFVPGRSCEWSDLLGDALGIAIGSVAALWLLARARRANGVPPAGS